MTLEEANDIVSSVFLSSSDEITYWNSLSDNDKKILISNITSEMEGYNMQWLGAKYDRTQHMEWPRIISRQMVECPYMIKVGLIKQIMDNNKNSNSLLNTYKNNGIKSINDGGGASISFMSNSEMNKDSKKVNGFNYYIFNSCFSKYSYVID